MAFIRCIMTGTKYEIPHIKKKPTTRNTIKVAIERDKPLPSTKSTSGSNIIAKRMEMLSIIIKSKKREAR